MGNQDWNRVASGKLIAFAIAGAIFVFCLLKSEPGFVFVLDHANLMFHEAGHPLVGLFGRRLEVYGGTLGQLTFPVVLAISFWRKGETLSFAWSMIWLFENGLNIARYMADARAQELPLVGGGDHDWANIFGRWHLLAHDNQIGGAVKTVAWVGMGLVGLWVVWRWWQTKNIVDGGQSIERQPWGGEILN